MKTQESEFLVKVVEHLDKIITRMDAAEMAQYEKRFNRITRSRAAEDIDDIKEIRERINNELQSIYKSAPWCAPENERDSCIETENLPPGIAAKTGASLKSRTLN